MAARLYDALLVVIASFAGGLISFFLPNIGDGPRVLFTAIFAMVIFALGVGIEMLISKSKIFRHYILMDKNARYIGCWIDFHDKAFQDTSVTMCNISFFRYSSRQNAYAINGVDYFDDGRRYAGFHSIGMIDASLDNIAEFKYFYKGNIFLGTGANKTVFGVGHVNFLSSDEGNGWFLDEGGQNNVEVESTRLYKVSSIKEKIDEFKDIDERKLLEDGHYTSEFVVKIMQNRLKIERTTY